MEQMLQLGTSQFGNLVLVVTLGMLFTIVHHLENLTRIRIQDSRTFKIMKSDPWHIIYRYPLFPHSTIHNILSLNNF